ncbi:acyl-CoA dehydrogenase family protein [Corynebacterium lowii]|uniref:Acyl-CoA dehydrogenase n=1 Tax=Corynebacterium lowii TaxID=1544413 RepID=A0A0Q0UKZ4_9CORY|nr:acyl-CoA dehydrogenase family protein [Corynebacterium lowii]KQB86952.1 Acyl-CoA dehydrogenase [Corynebacterium lowii]MDP9851641.1 glutaryl-CoA dehydrogenase [Corynebacterium lowii]
MSTPLSNSTADFYGIFADVDGKDLEYWNTTRAFADEVRDQINDAWEKAEYRIPVVKRAADLGIVRDGIDIPGFEPMSIRANRLITMELARLDGSIGTAIVVQSGLAMKSIALCGSEEQKEKYLAPMARCEVLGAFALTEPTHGSDSIALETTAVLDGDEYVINGAKKWIGQGSVGHITIVWARMEDGQVGGFIVPQDTPGYNAETIKGKASLRAIHQAEIHLENVRIPKENRLPGAKSFRDTAEILAGTRIGVAWAALGLAIDCYEKALSYAQERVQFGKPLVSFQIVQQRLSDMLQDIVSMALYCKRLLEMEEAGTLNEKQAALAKVHNTRKARSVAATARDMLGGVGILLENDIIRHMCDIEALHTYEGTDTIQSLIVGKTITGVSAYR